MKRFETKGRFALYGAALCCLALATLLAVRFVGGSGAYLTDDGDWQTLAGDYRIGIIDYAVDVNGQALIGQNASDKTKVDTYEMLLPLVGGVHLFDDTVTPAIREKECNEGATLARVRVTNRSDSMVEVTAALHLAVPGELRMLPLPLDLVETTATSLNYRKYILDTLGVAEQTGGEAPSAALARLEAGYTDYWQKNAATTLPLGILPGASTLPDGKKDFAYRDVFFILWSEYSTAYDSEKVEESARLGRLQATFTVGQIE